jgi:hypothetical protein
MFPFAPRQLQIIHLGNDLVSDRLERPRTVPRFSNGDSCRLLIAEKRLEPTDRAVRVSPFIANLLASARSFTFHGAERAVAMCMTRMRRQTLTNV